MPQGVPAQSCASQDLSGDCADVRHLGEDGREIHVAGLGRVASRGRGTGLNRVDENMAIDARTWREAEAWFSRLLAGDHGQREDFERWLHATPVHAVAWNRTQALWERMGTFVQDESLSDYVREALEPELDTETGRDNLAADDQVVTMLPRRQRPARGRFRFAYAAAAAIVVVAVAAAAVVIGLQVSSPQMYATGDHGSEISLADGSRVQMDIQTRLQTRFRWGRR